jgi:hypothetical protein
MPKMPKGIPRQVHVAIVAPVRETSDAQLFAQKRTCSRVKQSHDLEFFTVQPTSLLPPLP